MLRKTKIITGFLTPVVLLALAAGGIYWYGVSRDLAIEKMGEVTLTPGQDVKLGTLVTANVIIKCPWRRRPVAAQATVGKGCRKLSEPVITRQAMKLGYALWKVAVPMKPFRTGDIPTGQLQLTFNRDKRTENPADDNLMQLTIPAFKVEPLVLTANSVPTIAGKMVEIEQNKGWKSYWVWIIAGLVTVIIILVVLLRRGKKMVAIVITSWERALNQLGGLRSDVADGHVDLGICFSRLTDIVRIYLEQRFTLKSSKQTTYEFLAELKQPSSPLESSQRDFLQQFMQAADLVKFAKLPPDAEQLNNAMDKAETLIKETEPQEVKK
ncbi:MAG: hypothetical protein L3J71_08150 [Victivallaceae bacterium]|nr:hypothetical protein [Victivallaceae bacterium]